MLTEKELWQRAKLYMFQMSRGIDPITQQPADENTLKNERIRKCFTYVCAALDKLIETAEKEESRRDRTKTSERKKKSPFYLTEEEQNRIVLPQEDCLVSELAKAINDVIEDSGRKMLLAKNINDWLEKQGYLTKETDTQGKQRRIPTPKAAEIGLTSKIGVGAYGEYKIVMLSEQAQRFVLEHIQEIIDLIGKED